MGLFFQNCYGGFLSYLMFFYLSFQKLLYILMFYRNKPYMIMLCCLAYHCISSVKFLFMVCASFFFPVRHWSVFLCNEF